MPKLILRFNDRDVSECPVGIHPVSIGRLPDNLLVIDNAAVSSRHARVYKEGNHYVLEDLKSTNGTFVQTVDGEEAFVRRDSMQIKGEGLIGLGKVPDSSSPQSIRFVCEEP